MRRLPILSQFAAAACLVLLASSGQAQEKPITLKISHILPATNSVWTEGGKKFIDEVLARANGQVKFEVYPAGQLGSDMLSTLRSGLADVVLLIPSYQADKFPLTSVAELPGQFANACEGTAKLWSLAREGGMLNEQEYKPQGYRPLFVNTLPQYKIMSTSKEIKSLQDLAGLKVRANGAGMDKTVRALGASPVRVPSPELYDSLTRGTVDAAFYPYNGIRPFKMEQVVQYSLEGLQLGGGSTILAIGNRSWNALPESLKKVFVEAAQVTQDYQCRFQEREEQQLSEEFVKQNQWKVLRLTKEQAAPWHERVKDVKEEWSRELDRAGKPGSAMLKAFEQAPATAQR